jgi:signal transduction histidine kinase
VAKIQTLLGRHWRDAVVVLLVFTLDQLIFFNPDPPGYVPDLTIQLLSAAAAVLLWWRREHPLAVFASVSALISVGMLLHDGYETMVPLWVALYALAAAERNWYLAVAICASVVPTVLAVSHEVEYNSSEASPRTVALVTAALLLGGSMAVAAAGRYFGTSQRLMRGLERDRVLAVEQERARIARDLHDIVAHSISLMSLQAAGASHVLRSDPARAERALNQVDHLAGQAINELHRMLGLLRDDRDGATRPVEPDGVADTESFRDEATRLINQLREAGRLIDAAEGGIPGQMDPSVAVTAHRVIQESLTNASKYADPGSPIQVSMTWGSSALELAIISTNATSRSGKRLSTGHGLMGVTERVRAVGGVVDVIPDREGTYALRASLPVSGGPTQVRSSDS